MSKEQKKDEKVKKNEEVTRKIKLFLSRTKKEKWATDVWNELKKWNQKQKSLMEEQELQKIFEDVSSLESQSRNEKKDEELSVLEDIIFSDDVEYFVDQIKEVYVRVKTDKCYETLRADSGRFESWIIKKYNVLTGGIPSVGKIGKVLSLLKARAGYGDKKYELSIRCGYSSGCLWYDLANEKWNAVRIDKNGWDIVDVPPIIFKRNTQNEQVIPALGGNAKDLLRFVNIKGKKQQLLFLVSTIFEFVPHVPRPIQVYFGSQGSAKTTVGRIVKSTVDPSSVELLTMLNSTRELTQQLDQNYLLPFDNLTALSIKTSDTLCRAVTGGGLSKRKLYTDSDNIIFNYKRAIIINGVNLVANKPDLLDRSLLFELERIDEKNRKSEEDFWQEFNSDKPKIIGAIFGVLSNALSILPSVKLSKTPRMADFAKWGCAIAESLGYTQEEFIDAYEENCGLQNRRAIEENPVASAILIFAENCKHWNGTSQELLKELITVADKEELDVKLFSKSPSSLSRQINEIKSNLLTEDVKIEKISQRIWRIEKL